MTNKLHAFVVAGVISVSALQAEIVIGENLSAYGYIDMFALSNDVDDFSAEVAEYELGFSFDTETYSAVAELSYDGTDANFETVTITYAVSDELSFTAGNILSYLGWETFDATGLYQFSYAYLNPIIPGYAVGASVDYANEDFSLGVWVGEGGDNDVSVEVAGKYYGIDGITLFAAYADDPTYTTLDLWASYEIEGFTFAVEYVDYSDEGSGIGDSEAYLAMVNYAIEDFSITVRYSIEDNDNFDYELFTISPGYAFSDNLFGLFEYSNVMDGEMAAGTEDWYAVELLFTF